MTGSTAFLEPCIFILPFKQCNPWIRITDKYNPSCTSVYTSILCTLPSKGFYFSSFIWLETLKTIPISTIRNRTDVPP